ncbi:MAG: type I DNA topoisomerase [Acholeplasmataceae bacterium]|jgi:DNA topoisomerase-1
MKKLLIVESPSKAKTIQSYVGSDIKVMSSVGHIRDLATTGGLGVDIQNNFKPRYIISKDKEKTVNELIKAATGREVILATDPDREGEAIAWHLSEVLNLDKNVKNRAEFKEITKKTVMAELNNLKKINIDLVESQETRRIIDRIIGFRLSNLVQKKIKAKSAGRVQSVALKLVVELEDEILAFIPETYYDIKLNYKRIDFNYVKTHKDLIKLEEANKIKAEAVKPYTVKSIENRVRISKPRPAYITSTLQQDANNLLRFSANKTMRVAQQLYEGVEINGELTGLITYMRTDSNRISYEFLYQARDYIKKTYGEEYLGFYKASTNENSQDAHEAIRPTDIKLTPNYVESSLDKDQFRLYKMIYERTLEALMADAKYDVNKVTITTNGHDFEAEEVIQIFKGFTIIKNDNKDKLLPKFEVGDECPNAKVTFEEKQTEPPTRYSEATLIKKLEQLGIGRPSTYAHIISTLKRRDYVRSEKRRFIPTELGMRTSKALEEYFKDIINYEYTSRLETRLDEISEGKKEKLETLTKFYNHFMKYYQYAEKNMPVTPNERTGTMCPQCGNPLEYKNSSYGRFIGCSNYPKCKYTENIEGQKPTKSLKKKPKSR